MKTFRAIHNFAQRLSLSVYLNIAILGYAVLAVTYIFYYGGAVGFVTIQLMLVLPVLLVSYFYIEFVFWIINKWKLLSMGKKIGTIAVFMLYSLTFLFTCGLLYMTYG